MGLTVTMEDDECFGRLYALKAACSAAPGTAGGSDLMLGVSRGGDGVMGVATDLLDRFRGSSAAFPGVCRLS